MISSKNVDKIGATHGLNQSNSRERRAAEQVYVGVDAITHPSHPVAIDAWVGYESVGAMRISKQQATELIGLLAQAVGRLP